MLFHRQDPRSILFITLDSCRYDTFLSADAPHLKALGELHRAMAPANFSREVLERMPERLGVLEVRDVLWSDWGEPARVVETVRRIGSQPPWLSRVEHSRPSEGWDGP